MGVGNNGVRVGWGGGGGGGGGGRGGVGGGGGGEGGRSSGQMYVQTKTPAKESQFGYSKLLIRALIGQSPAFAGILDWSNFSIQFDLDKQAMNSNTHSRPEMWVHVS